MDSSSSLYMCFPCYQLFSSLEEVLSHQLTCHPDGPGEEARPAAAALLSSEMQPEQPDQASPTVSSPDQKLPSSRLAEQGGTDQIRQNWARRPSSTVSTPLIRYQCGDCGSLFESLGQWQQHRKLRHCTEPPAGPGGQGLGQEQGQEGQVGQVKPEPREPAPKAAETPGREESMDLKHETDHAKDSFISQDHSYVPHAGERAERGAEEEREGEGQDGLAEEEREGEGQGGRAEEEREGEGQDGRPEEEREGEGQDGRAEGAEARSSVTGEKVLEQGVETVPVPGEAAGGEGGEPSCSSGRGPTHFQKGCIAVEERKRKSSELPQPPTAMPAVPGQSFLCMGCGSGFSSEPALIAHRKTRHGLEGALHCCAVCGESFMSTTLFLYHRRQHREQRASSSPAGALSASSSADVRNRSGSELSVCSKRAQATEDSAGVLPCQQGVGDCPPAGSSPPQSMAASPPCLADSPTPPPSETAPLMCPTCGRGFGRHCHLRAHLLSHTGEKRFSCDSCPRAFSYSSNLARHRRAHQAAPHASGQGPGSRGNGAGLPLPHPCMDCPSRFKTRAQLLLHRRTHAGGLPFSCKACGLSFLRRKQLQLHLLTHPGVLSCPRCTAQFPAQSELVDHMQSCDQGGALGRPRGRNGGQLECEMCGHRCVTPEGLDLHRLSHSGQTPLRCPFPACRRRFLTSAGLEEHVLTHCESPSDPNSSKPRPFHCEHCGKDFTTASSLSVHLRIHTGERPYQCSQCGKRFRQIPHLRDHERLHSGARPFSCAVCGKSFVLAARLVEHARTHSGEKPYTCPLCPRAFRSLSNLGKHRKTHGRSPVPQEEGQAAVHTILLVQAAPSGPEGSEQLCLTQADPPVGSTSSPPLLLLAPSIQGSKDMEGDVIPIIQHAIEVIVEETV
nr:zinc finger and SCAN domain-containing protein 2-like isoform X2 [Paramormyrops kingsleyae]